MPSERGQRLKWQLILASLGDHQPVIVAALAVILLMVILAFKAPARGVWDIFGGAESDELDVLCHYYGEATVCGPAPPPMQKYREDLRKQRQDQRS